MEMILEIFLYIILFCMGTFFGSFFTLAVYRIPLKKDITHERSFCPNCNHKLGALDLVPVWSYIFLKGKCRYCGKKIRIRYLLLEVLSGLVFVLGYASFNISNIFLEQTKLVSFIAFAMMYTTVVLVSGIDKEYRKINSSVLLFGVICQILYRVYLYVIEGTNMYRYVIYCILFIFAFIIYKIKARKENQLYFLEILLFVFYILFVFDWIAILPICALSIIVAFILYLRKRKIAEIPVGFTIGISTIVYAIVENIIEFWIM